MVNNGKRRKMGKKKGKNVHRKQRKEKGESIREGGRGRQEL